MLQINDPIELASASDAFDEEVTALEKMFGDLEDMDTINSLEELEELASDIEFTEALGEMEF